MRRRKQVSSRRHSRCLSLSIYIYIYIYIYTHIYIYMCVCVCTYIDTNLTSKTRTWTAPSPMSLTPRRTNSRVKQLPKLGPVPDRALDCSSSRLTHALGRPTTALRPTYPLVARTCRASSLLAPVFRRNRDISVFAQIGTLPKYGWGLATNSSG